MMSHCSGDTVRSATYPDPLIGDALVSFVPAYNAAEANASVNSPAIVPKTEFSGVQIEDNSSVKTAVTAAGAHSTRGTSIHDITQALHSLSHDSVSQHGDFPNVHWRAISMQELRLHPRFTALPLPAQVRVQSPTDFRLFRQGSEEWSQLHIGRLTTSIAASALGFYEQSAAKMLRIPKSLRSHHKSIEAAKRLREPPCAPTDVAEGNGTTAVCEEDAGGNDIWTHVETTSRNVNNTGNATKNGFVLRSSLPTRRRTKRPFSSVGSVRLAWGREQEATSILAAVNYFAEHGNAMVEEAGMQPWEAVTRPIGLRCGREAFAHLPLLGASPDALLRWPDGHVEPVEVKNHSPFATVPKRGPRPPDPRRARKGKRAAPKVGNFSISDPGPFEGVAVWHLPQLYLHMLCTNAPSAIFMSCSATKGANIVRIHRNDDLLQTMLHYLNQFAASYADSTSPAWPPEDFFWQDEGYRDMLNRFITASRTTVEVVAHVANDDVQRNLPEPMFLDDLP
eukprot:m.451193 g.451193  ORF g.451193 m.451193 type:complete len:508 (+) comp21523_c0_seq3:114-1637(+)